MGKKKLGYFTNLWYAIINKKTGREVNSMDNINRKRQNLERFARNILVESDMMYQLPVNLIEIANLNGIDVYYKEMPPNVSGAIKYDSVDKKFKIMIKSNMPKNRQRFTLAHELSHFFLHSEILKNEEIHVDVLYRENNVREDTVDYLAGALLIDENMVKELYKLNQSITVLSSIFGVSTYAMETRLKILGVL